MGEPVIRLDKSKPYGTNHGDMMPEDPMYRVRYWQGGTLVHKGKKHTVQLPFDIEGELVPDDGKPEFKGKDTEGKDVTYKPLYTELMKLYRDAKLKRIAALAPVTPSEPTIEDGDGADEDALGSTSTTDEVNLQAYLRGEADYQVFAVRKAAQARYGVNQARIGDLVIELVLDHHLVPEDQLSPRWKALIQEHDKQRAQGEAIVDHTVARVEQRSHGQAA